MLTNLIARLISRCRTVQKYVIRHSLTPDCCNVWVDALFD